MFNRKYFIFFLVLSGFFCFCNQFVLKYVKDLSFHHNDLKIFLYNFLNNFFPVSYEFINVYVFFFYAKILLLCIMLCVSVFYFFFIIVHDIFIFIKKDCSLLFNKNKDITLKEVFTRPVSSIGKKMQPLLNFFTWKKPKYIDKENKEPSLSLAVDITSLNDKEELIHKFSLKGLLAFEKIDKKAFTLEELLIIRKLCFVLSLAVNYPEVYYLVPEFKVIILNYLTIVVKLLEKNQKKDNNVKLIIFFLKNIIDLIKIL